MDWVHCNNCFFLPGMGKRFFLTSCGHLYCADCVNNCATEHCKLCGNTCTTIPLSSQMKPDVEMYFCDPLDLFKKYLKEVQKVAEFQNSHRSRLFSHQKESAKKTQLLKEEFKKFQVKYRELESEKQKLKAQADCMRQMLNVNQFDNAKSSESLNSNSFHNVTMTPNKGSTTQYATPVSKWSQGSRVVGKSPLSSISPYPPMPARLSVLTPPANGKLGIIPGTPGNSGFQLQSLRLSSHGSDLDVTPKVVRGALVSPMNISPCSSIRSTKSRDLQRPTVSSCAQSSQIDCRSGSQPHGGRIQQLPYEMKTTSSIKTVMVSPYSPDIYESAKKSK